MPEHYKPLTSSLRSRLLILTFLFVMVISALIYPTSIAAFRQDYLETRLENAQIAALALEAAPGNMVSPELEQRLLTQSGVIAIIMRREDKSLLLGFDVMPEEVAATFDLRNPSLVMLIMDAFSTLEQGGNRAIRVLGDPFRVFLCHARRLVHASAFPVFVGSLDKLIRSSRRHTIDIPRGRR